MLNKKIASMLILTASLTYSCSVTNNINDAKTTLSTSVKDFKQSPIIASKNNLDWALDGQGFFVVTDSNTKEKYYTRKGSFKLDEKGRIVTKENFVLEPTFTSSNKENSLFIDEAGRLYENNNSNLTQLGQLTIAIFSKPDALKAFDNNKDFYQETEKSGKPIITNPKSNYSALVIGNAIEDFSAKQTYIPNQNCAIESSKANLEATNKNTDLAIIGKGFFVVTDTITGEQYYTRNGSFSLGSAGELRTKHGYVLNPYLAIKDNEKISKIDETGNIFLEGQTNKFSQLKIAVFKNPEKLQPLGFTRGTIYKETEASGKAILTDAMKNDSGSIAMGKLEKCAEEIIAIPIKN